MDRAENVCSDPDTLVKEVEHLGKVLHYNNYPQWLIDKLGRSENTKNKMGQHYTMPQSGRE